MIGAVCEVPLNFFSFHQYAENIYVIIKSLHQYFLGSREITALEVWSTVLPAFPPLLLGLCTLDESPWVNIGWVIHSHES